jgi:hypothetical protein
MKEIKPKNIYFHFLPDDGKLRYGSNELVKIKHTLMLPVDSKISMCNYGFHASKRAIDALQYAPGSLACIVTLHGEIKHDDDKSVAMGRTVLAMKDATDVLWEMACWSAEQALLNGRKEGREPHKDSWNAIKVRRLWLQGKATDEDLSAAYFAADFAARSAADSAAYFAADFAADSAADSAAYSAAYSAARFAADSAAYSAASYAAYSAARYAARSAARSVARSAARFAQNTHFEMLLKKHLGWED